MIDKDTYFKGTDGMRRLREFMDYLGCFSEGIDRVEMFSDKKLDFLSAAERVKMAEYITGMNEIYWCQFHNFIDKVHGYKKYMA